MLETALGSQHGWLMRGRSQQGSGTISGAWSFLAEHCREAQSVHLSLAPCVSPKMRAYVHTHTHTHTRLQRHLVCILKYFKVNYRHVSNWVVWKTDCFHLAQVVLEICQKTWVRRLGLLEATWVMISEDGIMKPWELRCSQSYWGCVYINTSYCFSRK